MKYIESDKILLRRYTHNDDIDMYKCWKNIETQRGYNFVINETLEEFCKFDFNEYFFWATIVSKEENCSIGTIRLSKDLKNSDLAIWVYESYRGREYGTESFHLALKFCFSKYKLNEIFAGCYEDNIKSLKMLRKFS